MKLWIHPPDGAAVEPLVLAVGESILIGREPDPEVARDADAPAPTRTVVVASPLVSSSHALVWRDAERVHARDLGSKNGTALRLDGAGPVELAPARETHLFLAASRPPGKPPPPATVSVAGVGADEFADRLKGAVAAWLAQAGVRPGLRVVRADPGRGPGATAASDDDHAFRLPLVDGLALEITDRELDHTQVRWDVLKAELFPYAYEQIAAFRACRAARGGRTLAFSSPTADRALRAVLDAARARLPLVLVGESGTGKTELAAIYGGREGLRAGRGGADDSAPPFVTVHCAHLEPSLAHSLLFGALKGSYTSAHRTIVGAVKLADRGTLFLDDVDALPLETQAKLLRFLDAGEYEPLGHGEREPLTADVQVVAGTNADLRAAVRERRFREDLYWRLHSGVVVRVPPLRDRPEDIEQLLRDARGPSVRDRLDAEAHDYLVRRHSWRGNFRECLRFCARIAMEPLDTPVDRRRCEEILAEAALDPEPPAPAVAPRGGAAGGPFDRALAEAVAWWIEAEGAAPTSFDELQAFCDGYLKSAFVAHALAVAGDATRPETFDRAARQRLGCDLSTLKRKVDDYLALRDARQRADRERGS